MAGEMTPEQWTIIKDGLADIKDLGLKMKGLELAIIGNGVKGLKQIVYEHEDKIDCLDKRIPEKPAKPVYSGKQVLSILAIVIVVGGFISSQTAYVGIDISAKMVRLETKIDQHILNP
jgi:hypothetical protein